MKNIDKEKTNTSKNKLMIIKYEYLYNIDLNDTFFDSLKKDYKNFNNWYAKKSFENKRAYITYDKNNKLGSFLMLKIEDEKEDYSMFKDPFYKAKRLKISTFKVKNTGYQIGKKYMEIIIEEAKKNDVDEIYVTIFPKYDILINFFLQNNFIKKTTKETEKNNSIIEEIVLIKKLSK